MEENTFKTYNAIIQECYEYDPIQNIKNFAPAFDEIEPDEEGCDTCIHFNNKECAIFKKEN